MAAILNTGIWSPWKTLASQRKAVIYTSPGIALIIGSIIYSQYWRNHVKNEVIKRNILAQERVRARLATASI